MAGTKQAIRTRIRSIRSIRKTTSAMELIAISKLKRQRTMLEKNRDYAFYLKETIVDVLSGTQDSNHVFLQTREDVAPLVIVFTSDMGLCGGYNINTLQTALKQLAKNSRILLVGRKGRNDLIKGGFEVLDRVIPSDSNDYGELANLGDWAIDEYLSHRASSISVLYTKFVNSMTTSVCMERLLPVNGIEDSTRWRKELIYEPNAQEILDEVVPLYVKSLLYSYWLETTTSEQSTRRLAMNQATENAEELIDQLTLQFNRVRQAAITQEINEIVATADALL